MRRVPKGRHKAQPAGEEDRRKKKREKGLVNENSGRFFGFFAASLVPSAKGQHSVQAAEGE
jgi:hypothetical protein